MSCVCSCGFDYSAFVEKHQIPLGARVECPECQSSVEILSVDGGLGEPELLGLQGSPPTSAMSCS
jgi:hypothetical protein